jgi:D-alanyl-D-alanine carboxypeptidase/D-alanyl-D-alanine-endopeptidase (penicillin-binding protein 4)
MKLRIGTAAILLLGFAVVLFAFDFGSRQKNFYAFAYSNKAETRKLEAESRSGAVAAADSELSRVIDQAIDESNFASARWGIFVMSLRDGRILYARDGDKLFTPASNMKIFTTAVALDLLGAEYRWRTSVYAQGEPDASGTISGDLHLYGRGAPDLLSQSKENQSSLVALADALYERGVRRVKGNVIGDESYFRGNQLGDGWLWNDVQWYFGAVPSALSINANEIDLSVTPATRAGTPATITVSRSPNYFHVVNNVATGEAGAKARVGIVRGHNDGEFVVWGEFPAGGRGFGVRLAVGNPALWAATLFKEALAARGIVVDGQPGHRDFRGPDNGKINPQQSAELASVTSKSLAEIVAETNKRSNNLYAELILRTLGKERGVMAPVTDPSKRERGDDEAGLAVIKLWLERTGIHTKGLALHDGSGLSRLNLVTPASIGHLLAAEAKMASFGVFRDSLPVAGKDGTLGSRMSDTAGQLTAKTGSLTYVDSLSGYATTSVGEVLAFSIICNDATVRGNSAFVIDKIGRALVAYPTSDPQKPLKK